MGKKLDALLGRGFKTKKFRVMANMAISRLSLFKNQRQARCSIARSDVVEFLTTRDYDRALLRVEQVIKEQNMLDVFVLLQSYCHLLIERIDLIRQEKVCPEELREAISSLIYAATRCGEFPELQEIRVIFTTRYGKEFANRAIELRNHCGVSPKIIQKLSTRMPSLEAKMKVLREIARDNNIVLQIEESASVTMMIQEDQNQKGTIQSAAPSGVPLLGDSIRTQLEEIQKGEDYVDSSKMRRKYKDVADAAQAAFESAAYAAAAARAAVELSRESTDPDDPSSPSHHTGKVQGTVGDMKSELQTSEETVAMEEVRFEKIHPLQNNDLEPKKESAGTRNSMDKFRRSDNEIEYERSLSASSSELVNDNLSDKKMSSDEERQITLPAGMVIVDGSEAEDEQKSRIPCTDDLDVDEKSRVEGSGKIPYYLFQKRSHRRYPNGQEKESAPEKSPVRFATRDITQSAERLSINKRPISVRTR